MATTTTKGKRPDSNQSLTKSRSLGRKPKPPGSSSDHEASPDGSDHKPEKKPLPNYLKPTISSRPDPINYLKKNHHGLEDTQSQKLLRRRSFDRPPSSPSTSSPRLQKSLNSTRASLPVGSKVPHGTKKSGLSSTGSSSTANKKSSSTNVSKKFLDKEVTQESSSPNPTHVEEEEIVKVETNVKASAVSEEPKSEDKEERAEVVQCNESEAEETEIDQIDASLVLDSSDLTNEEEKVIKENIIEEPKEERKEEVINEDKREDEEEEANAPMDEGEASGEAVAIDEKEEKKGVEEEEKERTSERKGAVRESPEGGKRQVVQGKKEAPSAYNDVIEKTASKLLENRANKVKALAGAFQTVIDYETAASK